MMQWERRQVNEQLDKVKMETAKDLLTEFAIMVLTLRLGKDLNDKIIDTPISAGGYLFMVEGIKTLAKKYHIKDIDSNVKK